MIPGFVISCATFPGVIVHEFAHKVFCHWTGTKVLQVCYFRLGSPAGFVIHEHPTSVWKHILIGIGPLFINTGIGLGLGLLGIAFKGVAPVSIALMWLAISVAMHSFPSTGDAKSIWSAIWDDKAPVLTKVVGTPLVGVIFLGAVGSVFWLDLIYGVGVVCGIPSLMHLNW